VALLNDLATVWIVGDIDSGVIVVDSAVICMHDQKKPNKKARRRHRSAYAQTKEETA